jgi:hypothetical protein
MQRAVYLYVLLPMAVVTVLLLLLFGHAGATADPFFYQRGDVGDVRCYRKTYLRRHIGKHQARTLFRENPDARSLCGVLRCRGERCHFDALVFVDQRPNPPSHLPPVQAKTRKPRR